jgi:hypothetical protein
MKILRDLIDSPLIPSPMMMIKMKRTRKRVNGHLLASKIPRIRRQPNRIVRSPIKLGARAIATLPTLSRINLRTRTRMTSMRSR